MMKFWWEGEPEKDAEITANFMGDHEAFMRGDYSGWIDDRDGALAAIILLDQWSRNMFRKDPRAFASDDKALEITLKILSNDSLYQSYKLHEKCWLLMPLEHSEDKVLNMRIITELEKVDARMEVEQPEHYENGGKKHLETLIGYAKDHNDTVMRFGRYPHRNTALKRESTPEEVEYLKFAETYGQ